MCQCSDIIDATQNSYIKRVSRTEQHMVVFLNYIYSVAARSSTSSYRIFSVDSIPLYRLPD